MSIDMQSKCDTLAEVEEQVRNLQGIVDKKDESNERYQAENSKLRREIENLN